MELETKMATFYREFFCASNETFREKFHSVLKDYIGAKVIKEMKEFFILPEIILLPRGTVCRAAVQYALTSGRSIGRWT